MITEAAKIQIQPTTQSRISQLLEGELQFGKHFSDHMFVADYANGEWGELRIMPYGNISLSPATSAIHYGQSIFEGMKAYKNEEGEVLVFRPLDNAKRLNVSADRMCMPALPTDIFMEALTQLLKLDKAWVPLDEDGSLYIRPYMFATDDYIGVKPSDTYKFMIITAPVGAYYKDPLKVKIETEYVRAVEGGTGFAKAAGNYGKSLYPAKLAQQQGYRQLIWTDAKEHKYIEESGTMNIMFVIDGKLITPKTSGTILSGITRDSVLTLAKEWGMEIEERKVSVEEVIDALEANKITEVFGTGTAATIAQITTIGYQNKDYQLPPVESRTFSNKVSKHLLDIKKGRVEDKHGWITRIS